MLQEHFSSLKDPRQQGKRYYQYRWEDTRRSGSKDQNPLHMVSAWANRNRLVLGQTATDGKSNEITAVPELLKVLYLNGCIVTAYAMSCQKAITQKITETNDKGHGRIEKRKYYFLTHPNWLLYADGWTNLNATGMVCPKVQAGDKVTEERRYFISSLSNIDSFSKAARAHWGIENSLHWCLDMTFREDHSRMRKDYSAENMAVVRHIALSVLKLHPAKISMARKRRRCSYDDAFLAEVLALVNA